MIWDSNALFAKAKKYYAKAQSAEGDQPEYALNAALALEFLSRSALCKVSPVLNADPQNEGQNILFALGYAMKKGLPRSIPFHSVTVRLEQIVPEYEKNDCRTFSDYFAGLRNDELHTGGAPFENLQNSGWLPKFYQTAKILCDFLGVEFEDFVGEDLDEAEHLIGELVEVQKSKAQEKIGRAMSSFSSLSPSDKAERVKIANFDLDAMTWGNRRARCPACASLATLYGKRVKSSEPKYGEDGLAVTVTFRAVKLNCKACGLELTSTAELISAGVDVSFTDQENLDLHDYFQREFDDDYMNM